MFLLPSGASASLRWPGAALIVLLVAQGCGAPLRGPGASAPSGAPASPSAGRVLGQRKLPATKTLALNEAEECQTTVDGAELLYSVTGTYQNDRLTIVHACAKKSVAEHVIAGVAARDAGGAQSTSLAGTSLVVRALPAEAAVWLATSNLYGQLKAEPASAVTSRGWGTLLNVHRSMLKDMEKSSGDLYRSHVSRGLLEYRLSPDVLCAAQLKLFIMEEVVATPGARAGRALEGVEAEATVRERYGLVPAEKGKLLWQLTRRREKDQSLHTLRILRSSDFFLPGRQGRVIDQVLVCRSSKPLLARDIPGLKFTLERAAKHWRATVRLQRPPPSSQPTRK